MSKETPKDDPRHKTDQGSHTQTDKPWKGNPEKEQRNDGTEIDLEKWHRTRTHWTIAMVRFFLLMTVISVVILLAIYLHIVAL
jgi:hypothetical protein